LSLEPLDLPYQSPIQREEATEAPDSLVITPFRMQSIVYELIVKHWLNNDPAKFGYPFQQRYSSNQADSRVFISRAFDWKSAPVEVNPSIIIRRGSAEISATTFGQTIRNNPIDSEKTKLHHYRMHIQVVVVANPVGLAEEVADFSLKPLRDFEQEIQKDYKLRRFRLMNVTAPTLYQQARDSFVVIGNVDTIWDSSQIIRRDDLRLKTVGRELFLELAKPLENQ
jgi:hypothetical protein